MRTYEVTVIGESREIYQVEAENEADAMQNWADGDLVMAAEVSSAGAVSAVEVEG